MAHLVRIILLQVVPRWPMRSAVVLMFYWARLEGALSSLRPAIWSHLSRRLRASVRVSRGLGQAANAKLAKPVVTSKNVTGTEQSTTATW